MPEPSANAAYDTFTDAQGRCYIAGVEVPVAVYERHEEALARIRELEAGNEAAKQVLAVATVVMAGVSDDSGNATCLGCQEQIPPGREHHHSGGVFWNELGWRDRALDAERDLEQLRCDTAVHRKFPHFPD